MMPPSTQSETRCIPAQSSDLDALMALAERTFRETFQADNDPVAFEKYMATHFSRACWQQLLQNPAIHLRLFYVGSDPVGYFSLKNEPTPYPEITGKTPVEIVRFYLDNTHHGSGLAATMMQAALSFAGGLNADTVWLGVWEKNPRAQRFYEKHGFTRVGRHDYWMGDDCQNDYLMSRVLPERIHP